MPELALSLAVVRVASSRIVAKGSGVSCQHHIVNSQLASKAQTDRLVGVNKTIEPCSASRVAPMGLNRWGDGRIRGTELNLLRRPLSSFSLNYFHFGNNCLPCQFADGEHTPQMSDCCMSVHVDEIVHLVSRTTEWHFSYLRGSDSQHAERHEGHAKLEQFGSG